MAIPTNFGSLLDEWGGEDDPFFAETPGLVGPGGAFLDPAGSEFVASCLHGTQAGDPSLQPGGFHEGESPFHEGSMFALDGEMAAASEALGGGSGEADGALGGASLARTPPAAAYDAPPQGPHPRHPLGPGVGPTPSPAVGCGADDGRPRELVSWVGGLKNAHAPSRDGEEAAWHLEDADSLDRWGGTPPGPANCAPQALGPPQLSALDPASIGNSPSQFGPRTPGAHARQSFARLFSASWTPSCSPMSQSGPSALPTTRPLGDPVGPVAESPPLAPPPPSGLANVASEGWTRDLLLGPVLGVPHPASHPASHSVSYPHPASYPHAHPPPRGQAALALGGRSPSALGSGSLVDPMDVATALGGTTVAAPPLQHEYLLGYQSFPSPYFSGAATRREEFPKTLADSSYLQASFPAPRRIPGVSRPPAPLASPPSSLPLPSSSRALRKPLSHALSDSLPAPTVRLPRSHDRVPARRFRVRSPARSLAAEALAREPTLPSFDGPGTAPAALAEAGRPPAASTEASSPPAEAAGHPTEQEAASAGSAAPSPGEAAPPRSAAMLSEPAPTGPPAPSWSLDDSLVVALRAGSVRDSSELDLPPPSLDSVPHSNFLTPKHLRKGKGGRQPAADPRTDPRIDPKKARRILANRLSAAKSKLKQKRAMDALQQRLASLRNVRDQKAAKVQAQRIVCARAQAARDTLSQAVGSMPPTEIHTV